MANNKPEDVQQRRARTVRLPWGLESEQIIKTIEPNSPATQVSIWFHDAGSQVSFGKTTVGLYRRLVEER